MEMNYINEVNRKDSYNNIRNYNIRVNYAGVLSSGISELNRVSDKLILLYVIRNSFVIKEGRSKLKLKKGDVYLMTGNMVLVENNNASIIFLSFESVNAIIAGDLEKFLLSNMKRVTPDQNRILRNYFFQIYEEELRCNFAYCEVVDSFLNILLINLFRLSGKSHKPDNFSNGNLLFEKAVRYIDENKAHPVRVEDIALTLNISKIYLYKIFRRYGGSSVQGYILDYKLGEAADILATGKYQIKEIAAMFGFSSSNHFSQSFKRKFGKSPKEFMKSR